MRRGEDKGRRSRRGGEGACASRNPHPSISVPARSDPKKTTVHPSELRARREFRAADADADAKKVPRAKSAAEGVRSIDVRTRFALKWRRKRPKRGRLATPPRSS